MGLAFAATPDLASSLATGDCASVAKVAPAPDTRLAIAWCALRQGDPDRALRTIPAAPDGILAAYEREVRAEALLAAGRPVEVAAALKDVALPGDAGLELRLLRAKAAWTAGDPTARAALDALGKDPVVGREARWILASRLPPAEARPVLEALWADARPGGWDIKASNALAAAGTPVPRLTDLEGRKLAYARFESLAAASRPEEALLLLTAIQAAGGQFSPATMAHAWFAARKYAESAAAWRAILGAPDVAAGAPADLFEYALTTARSGDYPTAGVIYRRIMAQHPTTDEADFASYKLGYMAYDQGDCAAAVPLLQEHATSRPTSKRTVEARWFAARCAWRTGDRAGAVAGWDAIVRDFPKSDLVPGAVYWKARASGDPAVEKAGMERVLTTWPVSGWAWFAAERLGRTFPPQPQAVVPAWHSPPAAVARAEALVAQGFQGWARAELAGVTAGDRAQALALASLRSRAGDFQGARKAARPYCTDPWKKGDAAAQSLCSPRPERALVESVAARGGMDPNLAYAIMLAESNLDPVVASAAGARGLMQLMPDLAGTLHVKLYPDRPYDPDDLYSAPYNATLGTLELSERFDNTSVPEFAELAERFVELGGSLDPDGLPAVIASYNGGVEAVNRWLAGGKPAFDEFSEDIGYVETRLYVRRVLGFLMAYRWTYGDPPEQ